SHWKQIGFVANFNDVADISVFSHNYAARSANCRNRSSRPQVFSNQRWSHDTSFTRWINSKVCDKTIDNGPSARGAAVVRFDGWTILRSFALNNVPRIPCSFAKGKRS
ncbi:MAG TPA: hypothetical protein QGG18_00505, partial [Rhodospirillales bacterium]|nr:hypothetical protein [Rhodospirillales bacterium]